MPPVLCERANARLKQKIGRRYLKRRWKLIDSGDGHGRRSCALEAMLVRDLVSEAVGCGLSCGQMVKGMRWVVGDTNTTGADPDLFDLLEQVCRERVGALPDRRDLRARAENVIVELLPYSAPSLDRVARRLGTSSRSLGRRLAEEGTSFKVLVDELRRELARRYLEQGVHRPKSIAALLGYKDLSAFHHAFRRWTGTTPAAAAAVGRLKHPAQIWLVGGAEDTRGGQ